MKRWKPVVLFEPNAADFRGAETEAELLRAAGYTEFYTIMPWPYFPDLRSCPSHRDGGCTPLLCYSQVIRRQDAIASNFYSFIIAPTRSEVGMRAAKTEFDGASLERLGVL